MAASRGPSPCALPGGRRRMYDGAASILSLVLNPLVLLLLVSEHALLPVVAEATKTAATDAGITTALPPCDVHGVASRDVALQNGSTFEMTCTLTRWPHEKQFKLAVLRSRDEPVPTAELHRNNETSITWRRPNVKDADTANYYCLVSGDDCESVYNATALRVGYFPTKPPFPTCSGDFEIFTCVWELPDNKIETRYEVILRVGYCNATVGLQPRNLTCQLKTSGSVIYRIEEEFFKFVVKGSNMFGAEQWEYNVDHFANVMLQPPAVVNCRAKTFNASVNWTGLPEISTFPDAVYEVRMRWDYGEDITTSVENSVDTSVDDLVPNTRYDVSVRVKFAKARDQLWSPFSKTGHCKTSKSRATVLPKVTENSFIIQDLDDHRKVRLFYQRVPRFLWNGDYMSYILHWCSSSGQCATHRVSGERSYTDVFHLSRVETYTFRLYSENELGSSLKSVRVLVPSADLVLPVVQDAYIVEESPNQSRFKLPTWRTDKPDEVQHYTLFWCSEGGSKDMDSCSGGVFWATVKSAGDALTAMECAFTGRCKYAIAMRSAHAVSPMTWVDCVVPNSNEYENLFKGQDMVHYDKITDTTAQFAFLTKCSGLVADRDIRVCIAQGQDEQRGNETWEAAIDADPATCFNQTAGHEKTVYLENLSPETTYLLNVTTVLEDGNVLKHRPLIFKTQPKATTYLATTLIVAYVVVVALAVVGVVFWRRVSTYVKVYKNTTVSVLIPADFAKEPLKKSESVRSNLREYVLGSKDSPYGLPQIIPRENKGVVSGLQYPELDCLLQDSLPSDANDASATTYTTSASEQSLPTDHPSVGYSLVSTTQDEPEPVLDSAYSKFSTFQDASNEAPAPLLKNNYSRLSSLFLGGFGTSAGDPAPTVPEQNGYSKFAAFIDSPPAGGGDDAEEVLKPADRSDVLEARCATAGAPYVQVVDDAVQKNSEDKGFIQPYTKLGCTSVPLHGVSVQGPPDKPENCTSGYTPLPTLMAMSVKPPQCENTDDMLAGAERSNTRSPMDSALPQNEPHQPYTQATTLCAWPPDQDRLREAQVSAGPYSIINVEVPDGTKDCLPGVHCAPPYVKAACEPETSGIHGVPQPSAKTEALTPAYSKVGARTVGEERVDSTCSTNPMPSTSVPENYAFAALPATACCEQTENDKIGHQGCASPRVEADLLSEEYSGPTKDPSGVRPTLCNGGYTSWEVLAKQRDCSAGVYARAVKNA
ncbi:uncharacterized protein LOC144110808 isoform X1 [Amblyomma americanum]